LVLQVTRHGARATANHIDFPNITDHPWADGIGELTGSGERQHYLLAKKNSKRYIQENNLLNPNYDPKEILILSTDSVRTTMSAYSELLAWYPLGTAEKIQSIKQTQAVPPFEVTDKEKIMTELNDDATMYGFQPVPIHNLEENNKILKGTSTEVCPGFAELKTKAMKDPIFTQINKRYTDNILKTVREKWGINETLDFATVDPYTDSFYSAWFDRRLIDEFMMDVGKIDTMFADRFYYYFFQTDEMTRIASTKFLNYIRTRMDAKIKSIAAGVDDGSGIYDLKLIFMSAHDDSLAGFLAGVEQPQKLQPFYASNILIELWKNVGTNGSNVEDYYAKWVYNDVALNINGTCSDAGA
jgi:hypothetical protein